MRFTPASPAVPSSSEIHHDPEDSSQPASPHPEMRILIVEDEPLVACFMREIFRGRQACAVDVAATGVAAFELLASRHYALVVSDVRMPEMNGAELYLWLREAQPETAQSFVFVTAFAEERHFERDLAQWGVPIVAKPFTRDQFLAVCGPYLDRTTAPSAS
jgi:CheY-like chemotaxis protein